MNIIENPQTHEGMLRGLDRVTRVIRRTYGGAGTNVIIQSHKNPGHFITNDCQEIVQNMKFDDPVEAEILRFVQELSSRTDKMAGDNRKTTIILLEEILKAGYVSPKQKLQLKRDLDSLIPFIEEKIDNQTREVTVENIENVATTASENPDIGILLQEIYKIIGKDGSIEVIASGTPETSYKVTDGIRFDMAGILSTTLYHDPVATRDGLIPTRAVYEHPTILVTKKKIMSEDDINPILLAMKQENLKELVIFTSDMDSDVARMLVELHKNNEFHIAIIKAPTLWRDYYYEDFAKCTNATIIEDATGLSFKNIPWSALGTCEKIIIESDETRILGSADISAHIAQLQAKGDDDSKLRLSWLNDKTAILRVGANSDTDLAYKRLKTNDAVRSCHLALKYGIVAGGGVTLLNVSRELPQTEAGIILQNALKAPIKQIIGNTSSTIQIGELGGVIGFDAISEQCYSMFEAGIIDSAMTVKLAVRNAIGIASTILTAPDYLPIPKKTPEEIAYEVAHNKTYDF